MGRAFLARGAAGEKVAQPGMPSRATYFYWKATQVTFAGEMFRLRRMQLAAMGARGRAAARPFDAATADRIYARLWRDGALTRVLAAAKPGTVQATRRAMGAFGRQLSRRNWPRGMHGAG